MLIDTHAHLASQQLRNETADVVARATAAGVERIVSIGTDLVDSALNIQLAEQHEPVLAAVGIHPTSVHEIEDEDWLDQLRKWCAHPKVVALGEMGLDFYHPPQDGGSQEAWAALQERFFRAQLDLAEELSMPVVIHQRNSWEDVWRVMKDYSGKLRAVFHCFTGDYEQAMEIINAGHLVSFTGIVTFKSAKEMQDTAARVPDGSFMVETDCPYLAPVPYRGKRCEPAYVADTAAFIAGLRGVSKEDLALGTGRAATHFFELRKD